MEGIPNPSAKHEQELQPRDKGLESVRDTPLHDALSENPMYETLINEKGYSVDDLYQFSDQEGFLYLKIDGTELDDMDSLQDQLDAWGLAPEDYIGYGTGPANAGFTKAKNIIDKINRYGMGDSSTLALYIPIAY